MTARCAGAMAHWKESMGKLLKFTVCLYLTLYRITPMFVEAKTGVHRRSDDVTARTAVPALRIGPFRAACESRGCRPRKLLFRFILENRL
jgi:hypothetical protein